MKSFGMHRPWPFMTAAILIPIFAFILACGPGQQPTPTPTATAKPAATPTSAPAATPTPTSPGPVATPTPTSVAPPTATPTPGEQPKKGGTLNFVVGTFTPNFDPQLLSVTPEYYTANGKLYLNLFVNYNGQNVECEICTEWHLEDGGKTMVFNLLPGIKFHTGQELTSADVAYSMKMIMGEVDGVVSPRAGVFKEYVKSIETPSKYVLRLNLIHPSVFVPKILAVSSASIYRDGTTREDLKKADAGAGPFIVKQIVPGSTWDLVRYPDYFKKGQPYLDGVNITYVADPNTRVAAFFTHKVDWVSNKQEQYRAQLLKSKDAGTIRLVPELGGCGPHFANMNVTKPPFNDIRMRKAVNLAVDRTKIAKAMYGDDWSEQLLYFDQGMDYATPKEQIWNIVPGWGTGAKKQQEIEQAKQLVKDAGYPNGLDIDQMARGPFTGSGYTNGHEVLQQELKEINIRTTLSVVDPTVHADRMARLDYLIQWYIWCMTTRDADEVIGQYWITGGARNTTGYGNPDVDKLYVQMSSELDLAKRKALFFQIQDIIVLKDVAYAPTPQQDADFWIWPRVQGFVIPMTTHSGSGFHRADRIWFKD